LAHLSEVQNSIYQFKSLSVLQIVASAITFTEKCVYGTGIRCTAIRTRIFW